MKNTALIIFLLLVSYMSNAQLMTTKKNGGEKQASYVFASAGVSIPVGFIHDGWAGISASVGPIISLGSHYFFNKRWGMGLVASGSIYQGKSLSQTRVIRVNSQAFNFTSTNYPNGNWLKGQIYISASYTPILRKRWSLDIVQGIGVFYISKPSYVNIDYDYEISNIPADNDWNTGYNIGLKGRVLLNENISLLASINYFYALDLRTNGAAGFNSVDCELGIVMNLKK